MTLLSETLFIDGATLLAALVAVTLVGLSKGGLGGAGALLGVPILSLVMPPLQAAALMLPILLLMDAIGLLTWRRYRHWPTLRAMIPAGIAGIAIGWMTVSVTSDAVVRLLVGTVALVFVLRANLPGRFAAPRHALGQRPLAAWLWGTIAGFTSFVAHAGGPPYQIYAVPLRLDPKLFTGTSVIFFATVNVIKVIPYFALGQFDSRNLLSSAAMLPVAAVSVLTGAAVVKRMRPSVFYPLMYTMIALVAFKLIFDGVADLL